MPGEAVDGVGAVAEPVPPVAVVYQRRLVPVAVSAEAVAPWQYEMGLVTAGAGGVTGCGLIVTDVIPDVQPELFFALTGYVPGSTAVKTPVVFV